MRTKAAVWWGKHGTLDFDDTYETSDQTAKFRYVNTINFEIAIMSIDDQLKMIRE